MPTRLVVIPVLGVNSGFPESALKELKPVGVKPIICWVIDHIRLGPDDVICIPYLKEHEAHGLEGILKTRYSSLNIRFLCLEAAALKTANVYVVAMECLKKEDSCLGTNLRDPNQHVPVVILNNDAFYKVDVLENWEQGNMVGSFLDFVPRAGFSYIKLASDPAEVTVLRSNSTDMKETDTPEKKQFKKEMRKLVENSKYLQGGGFKKEGMQIQAISETQKISHRAISGLYGFQSHHELISYSHQAINGKISTVIKMMMDDGHKFYCRPVANRDFFSLATQEEVHLFQTTWLLDLDGTLVTTDEVYVKVWNKLLQTHGLHVDDNFFTAFIKGKSDTKFLKYLIPQITQEQLDNFSKSKDVEFVNLLQSVTTQQGEPGCVIPGVHDFFEIIKNSQIAIVTSCNKAAAEYCLEASGLSDYVQFVIAAEDVVKHKPHPEPYNKAMEQMNANPQRCLIVEDSSSGLLAASRACVGKVCFFTGGLEESAALGSLQQELSTQVQAEAQWQADCIFATWKDLPVEDLVKDIIGVSDENRSEKSSTMNTPLNNPKADIVMYGARIRQKLLHLPVRSVEYHADNLKTGYICDILAYKLRYNSGSEETVILKIQNVGNELARTALLLDLYEKENYFYEKLAPLMEKDVEYPKNYGVIRYGERSGIILEDLRVHPGVFNLDLNTDTQLLMQVVTAVFKMHDAYYFRTEDEVLPSMAKLVKPKEITHYAKLVENRFETFITRNGVFMTQQNQGVCKLIAEKFVYMTELMSEYPLSFCHGDVKSPNIFYRFGTNKKVNLEDISTLGPVGSMLNCSPIFLDWQYIHLNKGVSDIVFLLVESIQFDPILADLVINYYYRLSVQRHRDITYEKYMADVKMSLCIFPFFVMVWFNSEDPAKLIDKTFPMKFMKNLLNYYTHFLDSNFFDGCKPP